MLKFLTHKLRTHSLNEENPHQKVEDDDHDSGTESDDEHADTEEPETSMDSSETEVDMCTGAGASSTGSHRYHATAGTVSPYFIDSALPSDSDLNYDHHSSEEELEVINSSCCTAQPSPPPIQQQPSSSDHRLVNTVSIGSPDSSLSAGSSGVDEQLQRHNEHLYQHLHHHHLHHNRTSNSSNVNSNNNNSNNKNSNSTALITRSRSASTLPEKRKWSQVTLEASSVSANSGQSFSHSGDDSGRLSSQNGFASTGLATRRSDLSSGSSDEEVQGLLATPVQFRTSPPRGAHRPGRSFSPPPKLFHYATGQDSSPRKRHRHATPHTQAIQRPCLDFEKMQQLKARAVTAWRHSGDHGGELSVFCW